MPNDKRTQYHAADLVPLPLMAALGIEKGTANRHGISQSYKICRLPVKVKGLTAENARLKELVGEQANS